MIKVINATKGTEFGTYGTRRDADKAIRDYLTKHDWDTDLYHITEDGKLRARVQYRRG